MTERAVVFPEALLPGFDIQEPRDQLWYWRMCCRACGLTWYLPKNPTRRTRDALTLLSAHAEAHRQAGSAHVITSPSRPVCAVCGGVSGRFERVACVGAPESGMPVHRDCVAEFFRQFDERSLWCEPVPRRRAHA